MDVETLCFYVGSLIQSSIKESTSNNRLIMSFSLRRSSIYMTVYLVVDISGYLLLFEK